MNVGKDGDPAKSGVDYTAVKEFTLTLLAGSTSVQGSFTLDPIDDALDEADETLTLTAELTGVDIPELTFTITDDDPEPSISIANAAAVTEGNDPDTTTDMSFPVSLSAASGKVVTVTYSLGGTATSGSDYTAPNPLSVTVPSGATTGNLIIPVKGDVLGEDDETVIVTLAGATNATLSTTAAELTATGTITDDDVQVTLNLIPEVIPENGGAAGASYIVAELREAQPHDVTLTVNAQGIAPTTTQDFTLSTNRELFIKAGKTRSKGIVTITAIDDAVDNADKKISVTASLVSTANLQPPPERTLTIEDDDPVVPAQATVRFEKSSYTFNEDDDVVDINVIMDNALATDLFLRFRFHSATVEVGPGKDVVLSEYIYFPAGATTRRLPINVVDNDVVEPEETFSISLVAQPGVVNVGAPTTVTITDDDHTQISIRSHKDYPLSEQVEEGNQATVSFFLSKAHQDDVTVDCVVGGTVVAGEDYVAMHSLTIPAGMERYSITIDTIDDDVAEPTETLVFSIMNPRPGMPGVSIAPDKSEHTIEIMDNDGWEPLDVVPVVSITPGSAITEGGDAEFTVVADPVPSASFPVKVSITAGGDYGVVTGPRTVSIPASGKATFTVPTTDDALDEADGWVTATLEEGIIYTVSASQGSATVLVSDDDSTVPAQATVRFEKSSYTFSEDDDVIDINVILDKALASDLFLEYEFDSDIVEVGAGKDVRLLSESIYFPAGTTIRKFPISVVDNDMVEPEETFSISLVAQPGAVDVGAPTTVTITDDDHTQISIRSHKDYPLSEQVEEGNQATVSFFLSKAHQDDVTVDCVVGGTVVAGEDYVAMHSLTIPAGMERYSITIDTIDDKVAEPTETLVFSIMNPRPGMPGVSIASDKSEHTIRIMDNDEMEPVKVVPVVSITVSPDQVSEGGRFAYTLKASPRTEDTEILVYMGIYRRHDGQEERIGVAAEQFIWSLTEITNYVYVEDDDEDEDNEILIVRIYPHDEYNPYPDPYEVSASMGSATVSVIDNDSPNPVVSIQADGDIVEGGTAQFTVKANPKPTGNLPVSVMVGASGDYGATAGSRTVTVSTSGTTSFSVATADDDVDEPDGSLTVTLMEGKEYKMSPSDKTATVSIRDNDFPKPVVSITADGDITEGDDVVFTIKASAVPPGAPSDDLSVEVTIETSGDYVAFTGSKTVTVSPGGSVTLTIATTDDDNDEVDGSVTATLIAGDDYQVDASQSEARVNVLDNDLPKPVVSITAGQDITEGEDAVFTISASEAHPDAPSGDLSVNVAIESIGDYDAFTGPKTVVVSPGSSVTLTIATTDDLLDDLEGSITATLKSGDGYTLSNSHGAATVNVADDDASPTVSVGDGSETEGGLLEFQVTLSTASGREVTVRWLTLPLASADQRATSLDYKSATDLAVFAPGETSKTFEICLEQDTKDEPDEYFTVILDEYSLDGATLGDGEAIMTIVDDD